MCVRCSIVLSECPELFSPWFIHFIKHAYSQSEPVGHSRSVWIICCHQSYLGHVSVFGCTFCIHMLHIWSIYTTQVLDSLLRHNPKWSSLVGGILSGLLKMKPIWQTLEYMRSHFVDDQLKSCPVVVLHNLVKLCEYDYRRQYWHLQLRYWKNGIKSALAWSSKTPPTVWQNSDRSFV